MVDSFSQSLSPISRHILYSILSLTFTLPSRHAAGGVEDKSEVYWLYADHHLNTGAKIWINEKQFFRSPKEDLLFPTLCKLLNVSAVSWKHTHDFFLLA